jgi:cysteine desulfurase/selenocysteine lyase
MIYLDNAATSYPKPDTVYNEVERCMRDYCANPGRGGHKMSIISGRAVMKAREEVSSFFNIKNPLQLCFTKNATEAINTAIKGYVSDKMHVVTTSMEHNAVARPLKALERDGVIELTIVEANPYGEIDPESIRKSFRGNTGLVVCMFSSNVNGTIMPIKEIGKIAFENGITFLVDAAQGAGDIDIDVEGMHIDMLAFPGHKGLLGPQGTGGLYVSERIKVSPLMEGGTGSNSEYIYQPEFMPDMLESGTVNTPGIIGLGCGVEFINSIGKSYIRLFKEYLYKRLYDGIKGIRGVKLYSPSFKSHPSLSSIFLPLAAEQFAIITAFILSVDLLYPSILLQVVRPTSSGHHSAPRLRGCILNPLTANLILLKSSSFSMSIIIFTAAVPSLYTIRFPRLTQSCCRPFL